MKNLFLTFMITIGLTRAFAQNCGINNIRTDWSNPLPQNPASLRAFEKNNFDWTTPNFTRYNTYQSATNNPFTIRSPFWDVSNMPAYRALAKDSNSDFKPKDGWELIKQDMGYLSTGAVNTTFVSSRVPYVILYNKVSGTLRFMFEPAFDINYDGNSGFVVELKLVNTEENYNSLRTVSGILNHYNPTSLSLDMESKATEVRVPIPKAIAGKMAYADFQMGYDPCTCYYSTNLEFNIAGVSTSTITLSGRALGSATPISDKEDNFFGYDNGQNYLNSVLTNGQNTIYNGAAIYKSWSAYSSELSRQFGEIEKKEGQAEFLEGVGAGAEIVGTILSVYPKTAGAGAAFQTIGVMSNYFASRIRNSIEEPVQPFAIHAELALSGNISKSDPLGQSIQIVNPGSSLSKTATEYSNSLGYSYPVYNEVLGTFALLNKPTVNYFKSVVDNMPAIHYQYTPNDPLHAVTAGAYTKIQKHILYLDKSSIKYAFNPALNVDEDNTEIYVAIVTGELSFTPQSYAYADEYQLTGVNFNQLQYNREYPKSLYKAKFISNFESLECSSPAALTNAAWNYYNSYPNINENFINENNIYLRIMIKMKTKPNVNYSNNINEAFYVFTYPVNLNNVTHDPLPKLLPTGYRRDANGAACDKVFLGPIYENGIKRGNLQDMYSYANCNGEVNYYFLAPLTLTGNANTINNSTAHIYSTGDIHLYSSSGRTEISPEVHLHPQFDNSPSTNGGCVSKIYSVNKDGNYNFQSFCNDENKYKSKQTSAKYETVSTEQNLVPKSFSHSLTAIPNPTSGNVVFHYKLVNDAEVILTLTDITGQLITTLAKGSRLLGMQQEVVNLDFLPNGMYLYTLETSTGYKETQRLVVAK